MVSTSRAGGTIPYSIVPGPAGPSSSFVAAGASRYWHEYDRVMAAGRPVAVLLTPERTHGNG